MRRARPVALLVGIGLAGCALSSSIVPVGPDTYAVSELRAPVRGGGGAAESAALARAGAFCQGQGRGVVLLDLRPDGDPRTAYWPTAFDATFRCVAGDGQAQPATPAPGRP